MNISPTQNVPVVAPGSIASKTTQPVRTPPTSGQDSTAGIGGTPNQESLASIPQEVVEVHTDTSMGLPVPVYEFVDPKSGSVVLQIPSEQMLKLVQDIRQRLQQMRAEQSDGASEWR